MTSDSADGAGLTLSLEEADAVAAAASGYAAVLPPGPDELYQALAQAAASGTIPDELIDAAERVTTVSLQTGRAKRDGQAGDERHLAAVYRRTPAGQEMAAQTRDVNKALEALSGRQLKSALVGAPAPGSYSLFLEAEGVSVTLAIDTTGVQVRSVQAG